MGVSHDVDEPVLEVLDVVDRVARAKEVLRRAEERTGARTLRIVADESERATPSDPATRSDPWDPAPLDPARADPAWWDPARRAPLERSAAAADHVRPAPLPPRPPAPVTPATALEPVVRERLSSNDRPPLPVPHPLREILPDGLHRGSITVVSGSTSLLLSLVAEASQAGSWAALVGAPSINLLAAAQAGVDLSRLVLVPGPGIESATTVAALLDGMDVVVVGPEVVLVDSDRRRLAARARERASVVLTMRPWQGAGMTLTAERSQWSGLGVGHGRLRSRLLTVTRSGRAGAGVPLRRELWLPQQTNTVMPGSASTSSASPSPATTAEPLISAAPATTSPGLSAAPAPRAQLDPPAPIAHVG